MGLALEESVDDLKKIESNSIDIYLDENLLEFLNQNGKVNIDYKSAPVGRGGFLITVGETDCSSGSCGGSC